jgi:hypothetical protein
MTDFPKSRTAWQGWGWVVVICLCVVLLLWGFGNYLFIQDRPRQWNFGQMPQAPGESIYSSSQPSAYPARQLAPLPRPVATREAR